MGDANAYELTETALDCFAAVDMEALVSLFADDAVLLAPIAPEPIPPRTEGKEAIAPVFRMLEQMFQSFTWTERSVHAVDDGLAAVTANADIVLANGQPYSQDFAIFVRADGGLITEWREYFDPIRATNALASLQA